MEYKRYVEFINNENATRFLTYFPVQLDATCNGFQHLALLSNEEILFKELNLRVDDDKEYPKDFYNFLIFKIIELLESKIKDMSCIENLNDEDNSKLESYKRLFAFG
jgi:DNA-directed RNA polymerase